MQKWRRRKQESHRHGKHGEHQTCSKQLLWQNRFAPQKEVRWQRTSRSRCSRRNLTVDFDLRWRLMDVIVAILLILVVKKMCDWIWPVTKNSKDAEKKFIEQGTQTMNMDEERVTWLFPNVIYMTPKGEHFHTPTCHHVQNGRGKKYYACRKCIGWLFAKNFHRCSFYKHAKAMDYRRPWVKWKPLRGLSPFPLCCVSVGKQPSVCLLRFLSVGGIDKNIFFWIWWFWVVILWLDMKQQYRPNLSIIFSNSPFQRVSKLDIHRRSKMHL